MRLKAVDLREKSRAELEKTLTELRTELQQLQVVKRTGGAANKLGKM